MYSVTKSLLFSNGESDDIKREIKQEKNSKDENNHNFVTKTLLYQNLHFKKKLLCANYVILYFQIFSIFREIVTILIYKTKERLQYFFKEMLIQKLYNPLFLNIFKISGNRKVYNLKQKVSSLFSRNSSLLIL